MLYKRELPSFRQDPPAASATTSLYPLCPLETRGTMYVLRGMQKEDHHGSSGTQSYCVVSGSDSHLNR
ncbi:hypothetical protein BJV77DRAFT_1037718, partial [Russula vinacea]